MGEYSGGKNGFVWRYIEQHESVPLNDWIMWHIFFEFNKRIKHNHKEKKAKFFLDQERGSRKKKLVIQTGNKQREEKV